MAVNYQIESTPLSAIIANLNPFATLPTTSTGAGEIIHYTGDNSIRWNSQTVDPTTDPIWSDLSAGGWDGNATSNLDMNEYIIQNCEEIEFYNTSVKSGEITTFHGGANETFFIIGSDVIRIESNNGYDIVLDSGTGDIDADSNKIKNILTPAAASDAATKGYVDGARTNTGAQVAADHGSAATDQIINVCYGTSATPPTASDTTEGTLYIQYTA